MTELFIERARRPTVDPVDHGAPLNPLASAPAPPLAPIDPISLPWLSVDQSDRVWRAVQGMRSEWRNRGALRGAFVMGAATYIEGATNYALYQRLRSCTDPVLRSELGWMYHSLAETLARILLSAVEYTPVAAMPGFHIYEYSPDLVGLECSKHVDSQFREHPWSVYTVVDELHTLSFTAAVHLPRCGAGMNWWPVTMDDASFACQDVLGRIVEGPPRKYPYELGAVCIHSGRFYHQIESMSEMTAGEQRVTLQGHGIFADGAWRLYW